MLDDADVEEEEVGVSPRLPKRVCTPFLSQLFEALHADISFFREWCNEDTANGPIKGGSALWMQRGALAERLQQDTKMEFSFRLCQSRGTCLRASRKLLKLYMSCSRLKEAVAQISVLCWITYVDEETCETHPASYGHCWPDWLFDVCARLVCQFGLAAVYAALGDDFPACCRTFVPALQLLLAAVEIASTDGCES